MQGNPYRRIRSQVLVALLGLGLVPLGAIGVAGYLADRDGGGARARASLEATLGHRKLALELFLRESSRGLGMLAAALPVSELSRRELLVSVRDDARQNGGAIVDLGLISDQGRHAAYAGPHHLEDADYSGEPWFQQVMLRGRHESEVFLGVPGIGIAVKKREGGRDWILRASLETAALDGLLREETGVELAILNRKGEVQVSSTGAPGRLERSDLGPVPVHPGVRVEEVTRGRGRELVATTWLKGNTWVLAGRQPVPGCSISRLGDPLSTVFLAGLGLVLLGSVLVSRAQRRQLRALELERTALYGAVAQAQKMAAIGRIAASIAHEVNNPLAIIGAQVGVLGDLVREHPEVPEAEDLRARVQKIEAQLERGRRVTHRLLGFSQRAGAGAEPVEVAAALEETVSLLEKELESEQIVLHRDYDRDLPPVRSSLGQMQQVFLNLINSAIDVVGRKGELWLMVRSHQGGVQVRIADSGPGIPPDELRGVFEPRLGEESEGQAGIGLGLAVCKEIMLALDGTIEVESAIGKGTTVSLWFPVDRRPSRG